MENKDVPPNTSIFADGTKFTKALFFSSSHKLGIHYDHNRAEWGFSFSCYTTRLQFWHTNPLKKSLYRCFKNFCNFDLCSNNYSGLELFFIIISQLEGCTMNKIFKGCIYTKPLGSCGCAFNLTLLASYCQDC